MGMPSIIITFKEKGITAIQRSQRGIVALVLKEADTSKFTDYITVYTVDDIPKTLTDANQEQIQLALKGYVTAPKKVIVLVQDAKAADFTESFKKLEHIRFDYLVIPEIKPTETDIVATWIKGMRETKDIRVKAVLPNCKADNEGVVNFTNTTIKTASKTYNTAQYCSRIAGIICGTPATISCTYAPLPEVIDTEIFTKEQMDSKVDGGELFLFSDGEKIKVARGVNSLVTTVQDKGEEFKKIKIVDVMDAIHDDIKKTAQDSYLGKYANSYDNRCLLITAIQGYFDGLEMDGLLEIGQNTVYVDIPATKVWLESNGIYTKDELAGMKEVRIKEANIHDNVFLKADISILDAIENITLAISI